MKKAIKTFNRKCLENEKNCLFLMYWEHFFLGCCADAGKI